MCGGLPMITEIVRSTANVNYGADNKFSNFTHGLSLLLMIVFLNNYLNLIPLSVLSAMLILISINMINVKLFIKIFYKNKKEFFIILAIIFTTLYIDLLVGVGVGTILHFVIKKLFKETF
jgi:MFS superfamily sulfate permease-like transporter